MMPLEYACLAAADFVGHITPYCERVEVAGSVRREAKKVKDIEVVAIPKTRVKQHGLWGEYEAPDNVITEKFRQFAISAVKIERADQKFLPGYRKIKGGDRYIQLISPEDEKIDLFMVLPPAQWGVLFAIRTGPWQFSRHIVTQRNLGGALPSDCYVSKGAVWQGGEQYIDEDGESHWKGGEIVEMPEEEDFFNFLELPWIEPNERNNWVRNKK